MPPKKKPEDDDSGSDDDAGGEANAQRDSKGDDLMKQAEKKMNAFSLFSKNQKYEEAVELYDKAAAQYKMNKNWQEAAEAYIKAAELSEKLKNEHEATTFYLHAAKAYKNVDTKEAIKVYKMAVESHMEHNRFSSAAKIWKDIGELQEKEHNYKDAQKAWQKAADCYEAEDSTSSANACHLKVASIAADAEDYKVAIAIYERVSKSSLESNLGRWSVKDYLYKALLCHFVMDAKDSKNGKLDHTKEALEKYKDMLPQFDGSRECKLIENCVQAFEDEDVDAYTTHVFKHDEIYKLDNWTAKILLEIKNALKNGPEPTDTDDDFT